ncbi:MAG: hypothetical protein ACPG5B_06185 [Chitinophagales bacterium]
MKSISRISFAIVFISNLWAIQIAEAQTFQSNALDRTQNRSQQQRGHARFTPNTHSISTTTTTNTNTNTNTQYAPAYYGDDGLALSVENTVYKIELGLYSNPNVTDFSKLNDLGAISTEMAMGTTKHVLLGDYAADIVPRILNEVIARGYSTAVIVQRKGDPKNTLNPFAIVTPPPSLVITEEVLKDVVDKPQTMNTADVVEPAFHETPIAAVSSMKILPNEIGEQVTVEFSTPQSQKVYIGMFAADGSLVTDIFAEQADHTQAYKRVINTKKLGEGVYTFKLRTEAEELILEEVFLYKL